MGGSRRIERAVGRSRRSSPAFGPVQLPDHAVPWQDLLPQMSACQRCELARTRRQVVVYRGAPHPWLLFVGEAPGAREDEQGLPFVGRAGKLLDEATRQAGLTEEEWGVTNVVMCRPPRNRFDRGAAQSCRPWLGAKVAALGPSILVTLGAHALEAFLPRELPVSHAAGRLLSWEGRPLYPMLHPASTLHAKAYALRWKQDWQRLAELLPGWRSTFPPAGQLSILSEGSPRHGAVRALPPRRVVPPPP